MKAWLVREKDEFCATVVFAETRGKAKSMALSTECCEDADFCRIEVRRLPQIDKCYKDGKREMDWFNPNDRIALVKECGFWCGIDYFDPEDCKTCPAAEYCDHYKDHIAELESEVADNG
jgi:hypothetical protein